jgi:anti-sigma B factor antagonist
MPHPSSLPVSIIGRPSPPDFSCSSTSGGPDAGWVLVTGELDIATTPLLEQTLRDLGQTHLVVLDLRRVSFMDSSGLHAIVDASIRARNAGRRLVVLRGPAGVDHMFALTGTEDDVEVVGISPASPAVQVLLQLAATNVVNGVVGAQPVRVGHR